MTIRCYVDGACRPNPGKGGIGVVIRGDSWDYTVSKALPGNKVSNNQAEYQSIIEALLQLSLNNLYDRKIVIYSDAEMAVEQLNGERGVERGSYVPYYRTAKTLKVKFPKLSFSWIPREQNAETNLLASEAITYKEVI